MEVGKTEGAIVGLSEGRVVGLSEGCVVGVSVGRIVGLIERNIAGLTELSLIWMFPFIKSRYVSKMKRIINGQEKWKTVKYPTTTTSRRRGLDSFVKILNE
jgi:hypothetical protein